MANPTIEERLSELEKIVSQLMSVKTASQKSVPWWKRHVGAFKDSPYYEEAMRLGAEYRRSQPTPQTDSDYEAIARELLAEMTRLEEQMDRNRAESERLKFETQVIAAGIEAKLPRLEEQVSNLLRATWQDPQYNKPQTNC